MELTKRTKVAGGVLALALGFLIWDRWSAPASASAATEATPAATPPATTKATSGAGAPAPKAGGAEQPLHQGALADRLEQLSSGSGSRVDAFAAPMEWFPEPVVAKPVKPKAENTPVDLSRHTLSSVMDMPGRATIAVVDKHRLCVGQKWVSPEGDITIELLDASNAGGGWAKVRINGREGELRVQNSQNARKAEGSGGS